MTCLWCGSALQPVTETRNVCIGCGLSWHPKVLDDGDLMQTLFAVTELARPRLAEIHDEPSRTAAMALLYASTIKAAR